MSTVIIAKHFSGVFALGSSHSLSGLQYKMYPNHKCTSVISVLHLLRSYWFQDLCSDGVKLKRLSHTSDKYYLTPLGFDITLLSKTTN